MENVRLWGFHPNLHPTRGPALFTAGGRGATFPTESDHGFDVAKLSPLTVPVAAASAMVAAALVAGAIEHDPAGVFGQVVAAWVQALGSIGAIAGAAYLTDRQVREALAREQRDREAERTHQKERDRTILLAASRLVSAYRVKLQVLVERMEQDVDELNVSYVGVPTRAGFDHALRNLTSFPLTQLTNMHALMTFTSATETAETVVGLLHAMAELSMKHPGHAGAIVRSRVEDLRKFLVFIEAADETLRDLAEPGWRRLTPSESAPDRT